MKEFILGIFLIIFFLHTHFTGTPNIIETYELELPEIEVVDNRVYSVYATAYHATVAQCDATPLITADGSRINKHDPAGHRWIAVSQDMIGTYFNYGDTVLVTNTHYEKNGNVIRDGGVYDGIWIVHDCMNRKWKMQIDFLINTGDPLISQDSVKIQKL